MTERELQHRDKQELKSPAEQTRTGRAFVPDVDIYETDEAIVVVADTPGADPSTVDIDLRDRRLTIEARVSAESYGGLKPLYTEYNVGPYRRQFELGDMIDEAGIEARVADGVLTLTLPKQQKARSRKIPITT